MENNKLFVVEEDLQYEGTVLKRIYITKEDALAWIRGQWDDIEFFVTEYNMTTHEKSISGPFCGERPHEYDNTYGPESVAGIPTRFVHDDRSLCSSCNSYALREHQTWCPNKVTK